MNSKANSVLFLAENLPASIKIPATKKNKKQHSIPNKRMQEMCAPQPKMKTCVIIKKAGNKNDCQGNPVFFERKILQYLSGGYEKEFSQGL